MPLNAKYVPISWQAFHKCPFCQLLCVQYKARPWLINLAGYFYDCACTPFITLNNGNGGHQFVNGINNSQWRVLNEIQHIVEKTSDEKACFAERSLRSMIDVYGFICHSINHGYQTYNLDVYLAIVYSIIFFRYAVPNLSFYFHQITYWLVWN